MKQKKEQRKPVQSKHKAYAYSVNLFVLGLTGGWVIPSSFHRSISVVSAVILLLMFLSDMHQNFRKEASPQKLSEVKTKKERPPKKKGRKKRRK